MLASLPASRTPEIDDSALLSWYFGEHLGRTVPVALEAWESASGWRRVNDSMRAIRAEWRFQEVTKS